MGPRPSRRQFLAAASGAAWCASGGVATGGVRLAFAGSWHRMEAAARAGFQVLPRRDWAATLADPSVDAVCVESAAMAMEACGAGKDAWVEAPVGASREEGRLLVDAARRHGRVVQTGTVWRSSLAYLEARRAVRGGALGEIVYCRAFEGTASARMAHLVDLLQFAFDEAEPLSAAAQGSGGNLQATFRYAGFVASYERRGTGPAGIAFHGTRATRVVRLEERGAEPAGLAHVAHWRNFLECIRQRRRPVSDVGTGVRSTAAQLLAELALRRGASSSFEMESQTS